MESKLVSRFGHLHPRAINALEFLAKNPHHPYLNREDSVIKGFYRLHLLDKLEAILVDLTDLNILAYTTSEKFSGCLLDYLKDEEGVVNCLEALIELNKDEVLITRMSFKFGLWKVCLNQYHLDFLHITLFNKL